MILDRNAHPIIAEAGGPAPLAGADDAHARRRGRDLHGADQLEQALRAAGRPLPAALAARLGASRPRTWAAAGCGRSRPCATVLDVARAARPARAPRRRAADERGGRLRRRGAPTTPAASTPPGSTSPRASARRVGAVLCGSRELIDEAWRWKQMLGGALRQAGIVAAACLYALDHNVERLAEDHENARVLADGLRASSGSSCSGQPETNIVICAAWTTRQRWPSGCGRRAWRSAPLAAGARPRGHPPRRRPRRDRARACEALRATALLA